MFFSRKNKGDPANVLLLYHGVAGQGMASLKAFPAAFLGLEQASSPHESFNPVAREGFNPSGKKKKNDVCQGTGKIQAAIFGFPIALTL